MQWFSSNVENDGHRILLDQKNPMPRLMFRAGHHQGLHFAALMHSEGLWIFKIST